MTYGKAGQRRADLEEKRNSHDSLDLDGSHPEARNGTERQTPAPQTRSRNDSVANLSSANEDDTAKHIEPRQLDLSFQKDQPLSGNMYDDIFMDGELDMPLHFENRDAGASAGNSANIDPLLRQQNIIKSPVSLQNTDTYRPTTSIHLVRMPRRQLGFMSLTYYSQRVPQSSRAYCLALR